LTVPCLPPPSPRGGPCAGLATRTVVRLVTTAPSFLQRKGGRSGIAILCTRCIAGLAIRLLFKTRGVRPRPTQRDSGAPPPLGGGGGAPESPIFLGPGGPKKIGVKRLSPRKRTQKNFRASAGPKRNGTPYLSERYPLLKWPAPSTPPPRGPTLRRSLLAMHRIAGIPPPDQFNLKAHASVEALSCGAKLRSEAKDLRDPWSAVIAGMWYTRMRPIFQKFPLGQFLCPCLPDTSRPHLLPDLRGKSPNRNPTPK